MGVVYFVAASDQSGHTAIGYAKRYVEGTFEIRVDLTRCSHLGTYAKCLTLRWIPVYMIWSMTFVIGIGKHASSLGPPFPNLKQIIPALIPPLSFWNIPSHGAGEDGPLPCR
jgi:hypothetical protein